MFKVGDAVIYPNIGICFINDIRTESFLGKEELFYVITPVYSKGSTIFSQVENTKNSMRAVVSKDELSEILSLPHNSEWIENSYERHNYYSDILRSCNLQKALTAVRTLNSRKAEKEKIGKKLLMTDEKALADLIKISYGEIAYVLGITYEEVAQMLQMNM